MAEPNRWYVSYTVKPEHGSRRYARKTRTFDTEAHAKLFAREIADEDLHITAGTMERFLLSPRQLSSWPASCEVMDSYLCITAGTTNPHSGNDCSASSKLLRSRQWSAKRGAT